MVLVTELKNVCACVRLILSGAFSIVWSMKVYPLEQRCICWWFPGDYHFWQDGTVFSRDIPIISPIILKERALEPTFDAAGQWLSHLRFSALLLCWYWWNLNFWFQRLHSFSQLPVFSNDLAIHVRQLKKSRENDCDLFVAMPVTKTWSNFLGLSNPVYSVALLFNSKMQNN